MAKAKTTEAVGTTDIALGTQVNIKVVKHPTNAAAVKTIMRIFSKDKDVRDEHRRQRRIRQTQYNPKRRGGRLYGGRVVKQHPIKAEPGDHGTIVATADVLADLNSVKRFVEVSPA